jgi:hypothetical protein
MVGTPCSENLTLGGGLLDLYFIGRVIICNGQLREATDDNPSGVFDEGADLVKRPAAVRADLAIHIDHNIHARQMNRQHAAIAVGSWLRRLSYRFRRRPQPRSHSPRPRRPTLHFRTTAIAIDRCPSSPIDGQTVRACIDRMSRSFSFFMCADGTQRQRVVDVVEQASARRYTSSYLTAPGTRARRSVVTTTNLYDSSA